MAKASALYEQGQAAHQRGDHLAAAQAFARADELVPDNAALEAALLAVVRTDAAVLGMELAGRTTREPENQQLTDLAAKARARFANEVGRIVVHCDACRPSIDGKEVRKGVASWVTVGSHLVLVSPKEKRKVIVEPGALVTLVPFREGPQPDPQPEPDPLPLPEPDVTVDESGPSPAWFFVGLGLTVAGGVGVIVSAVDTKNRHDDFDAAIADGTATADAAAEGEDAELRTNVLIGVTAGLAVVTAAIGIFVVDWSGDGASTSATKKRASLFVHPEGLGVHF
jgi:hypothetical protein